LGTRVARSDLAGAFARSGSVFLALATVLSDDARRGGIDTAVGTRSQAGVEADHATIGTDTRSGVGLDEAFRTDTSVHDAVFDEAPRSADVFVGDAANDGNDEDESDDARHRSTMTDRLRSGNGREAPVTRGRCRCGSTPQ
jgi:hypothetical protein